MKMHPTKDEVQVIYKLWKEEFAFDDGGFTDDFFKRNFTLENCYVVRKDERIVATLCAFPHTMILQEKQLPTLFVSGVITLKQERHKGYMRKLFQLVFNAHQECALFLLQAYHPKVYTSFDFHMMYEYQTYEFQGISTQNNEISCIHNAHDMKLLSDQFLSNYDGYVLRDEAYYENYIKEALAQDMQLYGLYTQGNLQGYARIDTNEGIIEELMYNDEKTYQALLEHALYLCNPVHVQSFVPLLEKSISKHGALMVRLHNPKVLKNILQREITTLEDVFLNTHKPLYHYGSW